MARCLSTGSPERTPGSRRPGMPHPVRRFGVRAACCCVLAGGLTTRAGSQPSSPAAATEDPCLAVVGATILPMDSDRVLRDQTVVIRGRTIASVGPLAGAAPGCRRLDARGRFLMPGLADLHTHSGTSGDLLLYLASGVTTILDLGNLDAASLLARRDSVERGQLAGPHVLTAFLIDGSAGVPFPPATHGGAHADTPAEGVRAVDTAKARGFDYLKVYSFLPDTAFFAIAAEARRVGIPIVGHGVRSVGIERSLAAGQRMVVHGEEYLYAAFDGHWDDATLQRAVAFTRGAGAYVLPNLSTFETIARQWGKPAVLDSLLAEPAAASLDEALLGRWRRSDYVRRKGSIADRVSVLERFTAMLAQAGVPLLLGTDSPVIPGMIPGQSLHDDLDALRRAGVRVSMVLAAGTRTAGAFVAATLPGAERIGVIRPGYRADLVLLDRDPREHPAALRRPLTVIAAGRVFSRDQLDQAVRRLRRPPPGR